MAPTYPPMAGALESTAATPRREVDGAVERVRAQARSFARMPVAAKAALLRECMGGVAAVAGEWVAMACRAKGLDIDRPEASEEWIGGPMITMRALRLMAESLEAMAADRLTLGTGHRLREDGRLEVDVFPASRLDAAAFPGYRATAVMMPGIDAAQARERQAAFYKRGDDDGAVSAVLGAGNVAAIAPTDAVHELFVRGHVAVLKMNPVNAYLAPVLERALAPLIERDLLRIIQGGGEEGAHLVQHPGVDHVHLTGSAATHDAIVWGTGSEAERRKRAGQPLLDKSLTSELGNISPVIIVPGRYSSRQLRFQARAIASSMVNNASCNCNASKLLVVSEGWDQRRLFSGLLADTLAEIAPRRAYYPGARERYDTLLPGHRVLEIGGRSDGSLPWALVSELDADDASEKLFTTEPFCSILSEVALPAADPAAFLAAATRFCNDRVWGTLNAEIVAPDQSSPGGALEAAVRDLRYGTVAINAWPAVAYAVMSPPWGGHPSTSHSDIQSGLGWVHNTYMLEGVEKVVLRAPLVPLVKPVWNVDHRTARQTLRLMTGLERRPSWPKLAGVALTSVRG